MKTIMERSREVEIPVSASSGGRPAVDIISGSGCRCCRRLGTMMTSLSWVVKVREGGMAEGEVEEVANLLVAWTKEDEGQSLIRS